MRSVMDESSDNTSYVTIGSKGRSALALAQKDLLADFPVSDPVTFKEISAVTKFVIEKFEAGEVDRVRVAFTNFVNTLSQNHGLERSFLQRIHQSLRKKSTKV